MKGGSDLKTEKLDNRSHHNQKKQRRQRLARKENENMSIASG
jgi:hypothetical protein